MDLKWIQVGLLILQVLQIIFVNFVLAKLSFGYVAVSVGPGKNGFDLFELYQYMKSCAEWAVLVLNSVERAISV